MCVCVVYSVNDGRRGRRISLGLLWLVFQLIKSHRSIKIRRIIHTLAGIVQKIKSQVNSSKNRYFFLFFLEHFQGLFSFGSNFSVVNIFKWWWSWSIVLEVQSIVIIIDGLEMEFFFHSKKKFQVSTQFVCLSVSDKGCRPFKSSVCVCVWKKCLKKFWLEKIVGGAVRSRTLTRYQK